MSPEWLLAAIVIAKRLTPMAITSIKTWTASPISEMLLLKRPPATSTAAIAAVTKSDSVSSLFADCCGLTIVNVYTCVLAVCCIYALFSPAAILYLGKRDLRWVLVFHYLRNSFPRVHAVDERGLGYGRVLERDHYYLVVLRALKKHL